MPESGQLTDTLVGLVDKIPYLLPPNVLANERPVSGAAVANANVGESARAVTDTAQPASPAH